VASSDMLLGFDARKTWLDPAAHWKPERRLRYLLRSDAEPVRSTDDMVWPSVFRTHNLPLASDGELDALGLSGPERPDWVGPNLPLWDDLGALRAQLASSREPIRGPYQLIAISCLVEPGRIAGAPYGPHATPTKPATRDPSWTLLGYDVADGSLVSALSNCGYATEAERQTAASRWATRLNLHHLFDSDVTADEFAREADRRVAEHAPFFVCALYVIEDGTGL